MPIEFMILATLLPILELNWCPWCWLGVVAGRFSGKGGVAERGSGRGWFA